MYACADTDSESRDRYIDYFVLLMPLCLSHPVRYWEWRQARRLYDTMIALLPPAQWLTLRSLVFLTLFRPDLTTKKRRGGRKMRRMKERFEETAMMKQANTRAFSSQAGEYGDDAMGLTMGLLDNSDAAAGVRKMAEKRKVREVNTKASRKRAAQMSAGTTKSGLESSVVFTPVQGMELVNPDANKDRVREANRKWFSDKAGFESALPKT